MPAPRERDELVMMIVESALGRPRDTRDEYIRSMLSGSAPELYEEVRLRIEWEERMGDFLRVPVVERKQSVDQPFQPGELVSNRFRIIRVAGRGGMGVVYEAHDEKVDRRIAIKAAKAGFQNRLSPETRSAREVSHYNVCKVYELHTASTPGGDIDFLTMEFVDGETLNDRITRAGPLKPAEAREIARQICEGLAQAHRQGVVHGDLKCANVILAKTETGALRAVLTDFGLAKLGLGGAGSAGRGERGGTVGYMAPELFRGKPASTASDIYALGVLFHFMLAGKMPERKTDDAAPVPSGDVTPSTVTLAKAAKEDLEMEAAALPAPWNAIVTRCLDAEPEKRFHTAAEIALALQGSARTRLRIALAAAFVLVAAVLGYWRWQSHQNANPVRLAILPMTVEGAPIPLSLGIAQDVAARIGALRRNFLVIPPNEAQRNRVASPEQAKTVLGATHALTIRLQHSGDQVVMLAQVLDLNSGVVIKELKANYAQTDISPLAKAVTATIAGAFHAPSPPETVSAAAYPFYVQGIAFMLRDNLSADKAIPFFQKAIELDPKSALVYAGFGEALMQRAMITGDKQKLDEAGTNIQKARSLNAESVPVLLASGFWNQRKSDYEHAIQDYSRAAELEPANPEAWRRLANLYVLTDHPELAISTYRKAIAAEPGSYRHYMDLGVFYYNRGRYSEAEELFRKVTALTSGLQAGFSNLGGVLISLGRFPEAEQALLEALKLNKTAAAFSNLGVVYNLQNRPVEALPMFENALALGEPSVQLFSNLGFTYRHLGRRSDALDAYRKGRALAEQEVTTDPKRPAPRASLALFCAYLGDTNRAAFEIAQAASLAPDNSGVLRLAVLTYEVLVQRDKTLEVLQNAPGSLLASLNREPDLKSLQEDSRFVDLLTRKPAQ